MMNGKEFQGTGSGSYNKIVLTKSNLTPVEGRDWEYSGQVYCKLSYNNSYRRYKNCHRYH